MHTRQQRLNAVTGNQFTNTALGGATGGKPGVEVTDSFVADPHVREQDLHGSLIDLALFHQLDRWNTQTLLVDLTRCAGHRAWYRPADICPVLANSRKEHQLSVVKHRVDQGHIIQVGTTQIGVIHDDYVTRCEIISQNLQR